MKISASELMRAALENETRMFEQQVVAHVRAKTQAEMLATIPEHELKRLNKRDKFKVYLKEKIKLLRSAVYSEAYKLQSVHSLADYFLEEDPFRVHKLLKPIRLRLLNEILLLDRPKEIVQARADAVGDVAMWLSEIAEQVSSLTTNWIWQYPPGYPSKREQLEQGVIEATWYGNRLKVDKQRSGFDIIQYRKAYSGGPYAPNIFLLEVIDVLAILNKNDFNEFIKTFFPSYYSFKTREIRRALFGETPPFWRSKLSQINHRVRSLFSGLREKPKKRKNKELSQNLSPLELQLITIIRSGQISEEKLARLLQALLMNDDGETSMDFAHLEDSQREKIPLDDLLQAPDDQTWYNTDQ